MVRDPLKIPVFLFNLVFGQSNIYMLCSSYFWNLDCSSYSYSNVKGFSVHFIPLRLQLLPHIQNGNKPIFSMVPKYFSIYLFRSLLVFQKTTCNERATVWSLKMFSDCPFNLTALFYFLVSAFLQKKLLDDIVILLAPFNADPFNSF